MTSKWGRAAAALAFWLAVWALAAAVIDRELLLPGPAAVARTLAQLAPTGEFWRSAGLSLCRVTAGFLLAGALGTALGTATAFSRWCDVLLSPALRAVRTIPVVSFILLLFFWLPTGWVPTAVSALMALPVIWRATGQGIAGAAPLLLELAQSYGLSRWRRFRLIRWPGAFPALAAGWETALGLSWKAGVAAEVLCQPKWGAGTSLQVSKAYLDTPGLFAWTAVVVAMSLLMEGLLKWTLGRWRGGGGQ